jgi:hypothetical protein
MNTSEFHDKVCEYIKENCPDNTICVFACENGEFYVFAGGPGVSIQDDRYSSLALCLAFNLGTARFEQQHHEEGQMHAEPWPFPTGGSKH